MRDLRKAAEMALAKLDHLWEIAVDERMGTDVLPEIKALRQALAMENFSEVNQEIEEALRQAPAQEQEPVACAKVVEADGLARGDEGLVLIKAAGRIRARSEK